MLCVFLNLLKFTYVTIDKNIDLLNIYIIILKHSKNIECPM